MKRVFIAAAMACSFLSAMVYAEPQEIIAARDVIKGGLKDPDSAKFRGEMISGSLVCGEVNAKNSYGGYVGFKRFMVQEGIVTFDDEEHPRFKKWWLDNCFK